MISQKPHVSIIITNYNYAKFICRCIESCLGQNYDFDFEVIFVDDGSTDDSLKIANLYKEKGLRIISQKNRGVESASNNGFETARGKYVVRVDADDYLHSDYLKKVLSVFTPDISFVYSDYYIVDEDDELINEMHLPDFDTSEILSRGDFLATGTMYRKSDIERLGYYTTKIKNCGLENYELIIKMLYNGNYGLHVKNKLFYYRRHKRNLSATKQNTIIAYGKDMFKRLGTSEYSINKYHPYMNYE